MDTSGNTKMSIEQKAKAYDEALERARKIKNGEGDWRYSDLIEIGPALTEIFSELRESEDERARKWLVNLVENLGDPADEEAEKELEVMRPLALAYLEKQKEPTPADGWDYADNRMSHPLYLEGFEAGRAVERELSEFEKQKEEKLDSIRIKCKEHDERREEIRVTEIIESIIRVYGKTQGEFTAGYDIDTLIHWVRMAFDCLNKQNIQQEQKPVVSLDTMLSKDPHLPKQAIKDEQKPAKWSEEDEKELDCIINVLDRLGFEEFCKSSRDQDNEEERFYYKEIQFLKRLKSLRPSWKPSEEQMEALKETIDFAPETFKPKCLLESLYECLKKRM